MSGVRSPTQRTLELADIVGVVRDGLGARVTDAAELTGGGFATVWQAILDDGRDVVVKVGPPASARLLEYEKGVLPAEAEYFRMVRSHAPGVPVPEVLAAGPHWVITSRLPGRALTEGDSPAARRQLGAAIARIHKITGPHFGYTGDRPAGSDWPTAFAAMIDSLRADAAHWQVPLPPLDGVVDRHHGALATVTTPALLHFDLWDGNVLVAADGSLSGLVDGERYLYGDPLLDLVSPALFRRIEDEPSHPFLAGYRTAAPLDQVRLSLYRVHLYVLMLAEGPSRGIPVTDGRHDFLTGLLTAELEALDELGGRR
ncbi:phosphotransferase [Actinoplanes sp. NEAU-A11]|uniref:Phosphotransferase n=1 Tax=Actinoplanes aureus TaxID=2792083 RepID=A0A931C8K0_9ACTN|nr:phosphotransferase [Actinoplanes aureus]MBG0560320.1 phosphotransferase [Actinoplanes aureus]